MTYDVAISFAGEQRTEARQIADCLTKRGLTVFFDEYEDAQLWGKNLYDHLSRVYHEEARYCIVLVSRAYAKNVWPNHERQSAQARALQEKDTEYILPVRFDRTELPGLLPTVAYLDFEKYGSNGICDAFSRKIGKPVLGVRARPSPKLIVNSSKLVLVLDRRSNTIAYIPANRASWGAREISFEFEPDDPTDGPFLDSLQGITHDIVIAYAGKVAICNNVEVTHESDREKDVWNVSAQIQETDFSTSLEAGTSGTSKDKFAEMRARRLLLNEYPVKDTRDPNEIFREVLLAGQEVLMEVKGSPFPALFAVYGKDPQKFLEIAWIHSAMYLKVSNCVVEIERLRLELEGQVLQVSFKGKRRKEYQNAPAYQIKVEGSCVLQKA